MGEADAVAVLGVAAGVVDVVVVVAAVDFVDALVVGVAAGVVVAAVVVADCAVVWAACRGV